MTRKSPQLDHSVADCRTLRLISTKCSASETRPLAWPLTENQLLAGEQESTGHLFAGAFGLYRNSPPRSGENPRVIWCWRRRQRVRRKQGWPCRSSGKGDQRFGKHCLVCRGKFVAPRRTTYDDVYDRQRTAWREWWLLRSSMPVQLAGEFIISRCESCRSMCRRQPGHSTSTCNPSPCGRH